MEREGEGEGEGGGEGGGGEYREEEGGREGAGREVRRREKEQEEQEQEERNKQEDGEQNVQDVDQRNDHQDQYLLQRRQEGRRQEGRRQEGRRQQALPRPGDASMAIFPPRLHRPAVGRRMERRVGGVLQPGFGRSGRKRRQRQLLRKRHGRDGVLPRHATGCGGER